MRARNSDVAEVRLCENNLEREWIDNECEMYAVLNALECLEKVFARDFVSRNEYTGECSKLLVQYNVTLRLLETHMNIDEFIQKYRIHCPAAMERVREGRPITVRDDKGNALKCIADIVELFITLLDQIKLNIRAADELYPNLNELYASINSMGSLPEDHEVRATVSSWHIRLKGMAAHDELTDEQARQMTFEVEQAYNAFQRFLRNT